MLSQRINLKSGMDNYRHTRTRSPGPPGFRRSLVAFFVRVEVDLRMRLPSTRKLVRSPSCRCALSCMLLG
jgi:hypothetical protein